MMPSTIFRISTSHTDLLYKSTYRLDFTGGPFRQVQRFLPRGHHNVPGKDIGIAGINRRQQFQKRLACIRKNGFDA